ncbi:hypothetical protein H2200_002714 [Cladophialophora chaetospira]|uniref:ATP-grasp domain-containing protein n=1 Tax=Cladophialophora chaetospira TaxID=386627 RepID=A0AA38XJE5_9EURO|nr:hypothetical protein H2200_002714 [Cladophialophora chaetospira]
MPASKALTDLFLAFLVLCCLPLSTPILLLNYVYVLIFPLYPVHKRLRRTPGFKSRKILITGVDTRYGLRLARAFHQTGHVVVGAYYEPGPLLNHVRFSNAVSRFYRLASETRGRREASYVANLLNIVEREHADLWIDCFQSADPSVEARTREAVQEKTNCKCFALRAGNVPYLASRDAFLKYLENQGYTVPESYQVTSRAEIHNVLGKARGTRRYLLESLEPNGVRANMARTKLPSRTVSQTYDAISRISITNTTPWKLERDVNGLENISTSAIVVRGSVKLFVASRTIRPGCYQVLEPTSALSRSMLRFVQTFARKEGSEFTTHLGVDFCVDEQPTESGVVQTILPVQVSIHAQPALQSMVGMNGSIALSRAYLSIFAPAESKAEKKMTRPVSQIIQQQPQTDDVALPQNKIIGVYCIGQDLTHFLFEPLAELVAFRNGLTYFLRQLTELLGHLVFWKDDTYDFRDPLPFWWSYQICLPLRLLMTNSLMTNPSNIQHATITNGEKHT